MTTPPLPSLSKLLSPYAVEDFTRQFDGRKPVVLQPVIAPPLDLAALDAFVAGAGLRWPTVHLEGRDGPVHPASYSRSVQWGTGQEHHLVNVDALREGLTRGERVVFADLQRQHGPSAHLVRAYEASFHMRGSATAVLAPAAAVVRTIAAAAVHRHLVQCHGSRTCRVTAPDGTTDAFALTAGKVLYVPPGHGVTTEPTAGSSLAVDVSLRPIRMRDLAAAELATIPRDQLRAPIPHNLGQNPDALVRQWTDLVESLLDDVDHEGILEGLVDQFVQTRLPMLRGQLTASRDVVGPRTRIRRRSTAMYRVADTGSGLELRFHGKGVTFPPGAGAVVNHIVTAADWCAEELLGVPPNHQLAIARLLVSEGFCEVVKPS